jgi:hypothetical protein
MTGLLEFVGFETSEPSISSFQHLNPTNVLFPFEFQGML